MPKLKLNANVLRVWAGLTKCVMCKHRETEAHLLPTNQKGRINPSPSWMFHYQDTHGLPHQIVIEWIVNSIYDQPMDSGAIKVGGLES